MIFSGLSYNIIKNDLKNNNKVKKRCNLFSVRLGLALDPAGNLFP